MVVVVLVNVPYVTVLVGIIMQLQDGWCALCVVALVIVPYVTVLEK